MGAEIFDTSADSSEVAIAVNKVEDAKDLTPEELLKKALKNIMI